MSLYSPRSQAVFSSAERERLEPPDEIEWDVPPLPPVGVCPYCRQALIVVEGATECPSNLTGTCDYDGFLTEAENRKRFQEEPWKPEL